MLGWTTDLLPMLKRAPGVKTGILDTAGQIHFLRPNHKVPPTSDPAIRHAMLAAIDQKEVMQAAMGEVADTWKAPMGFIVPGMPSATEAGMDIVRKRKTIEELKRLVEQSGYAGERLAFMLADSRVPVVLAQERLISRPPSHAATVAAMYTSDAYVLPAGAPPAIVARLQSHGARVVLGGSQSGDEGGRQAEHRQRAHDNLRGQGRAAGTRPGGRRRSRRTRPCGRRRRATSRSTRQPSTPWRRRRRNNSAGSITWSTTQRCGRRRQSSR